MVARRYHTLVNKSTIRPGTVVGYSFGGGQLSCQRPFCSVAYRDIFVYSSVALPLSKQRWYLILIDVDFPIEMVLARSYSLLAKTCPCSL